MKKIELIEAKEIVGGASDYPSNETEGKYPKPKCPCCGRP